MNPSSRVAVVGAGLTVFRKQLADTPDELAAGAARGALESAGVGLSDVDHVVTGSAPDAFDGFHMKGETLSLGSGGAGRPFTRVYVGGGTGVFTSIGGWWHVASGQSDLCLAVAEEKMSSCKPHPQYAFLTIFDNILERPLRPNLLWIFALEMNRYMSRYDIDKEKIAQVSVKNKKNALDHPSSQLGADITVEEVLDSEVIAWPVQLLDVSPTSDGAAALVLASEEKAKELTDDPVWIDGVGWNIDTSYWTNRDLSYPRYLENAANMAYSMADVSDPPNEIDVAEVYDPFNYKELHHMEGLQLCGKGEAPDLAWEGVTARDGDLPVTPSGGLLGVGNPIAAAGLMKVCEIYWQLKGEAGRRQVPDDPSRGLAQAWGDLMQFGSVVVMSR